MTTYSQPVTDRHGNVMFSCAYCSGPISLDDIEDQGLRAPDDGESADEYLASELVDAFLHDSCRTASKAG